MTAIADPNRSAGRMHRYPGCGAFDIIAHRCRLDLGRAAVGSNMPFRVDLRAPG